jgi:4-amino-4-deoxy-L-arabinose transferase-like glycosyltransferase
MRDRVRDYALLLTVSAFLTLPNLGAPSLWDMDEGLNAQASREMKEAHTWVIPTFNYQLRTAKPAMINWLQRISYEVFGVSEWSARLPSVLAGWLSVLLVYELARRMFDRATGLLAGLILASVAHFVMLVHAATPDSTLLAFTSLAYLLFWNGHVNGSRRWWYPMAAAAGLAFLTKGPIAVVLPAIVVFLYFTWNRELKRLLDIRLAWAVLIFILVAGPWYGLVSSETRGEWVKAFFTNENVNRFLSPMDRHSGNVAYYLLIIPVMFAPWCVFLFPTFWYGLKGTVSSCNSMWVSLKRSAKLTWGRIQSLTRVSRTPKGMVIGNISKESASNSPILPQTPANFTSPSEVPASPELTDSIRAHRLLLSWALAYVVFFSAAATKLPHYIFPIYPALAILTARFLIGWRSGSFAIQKWLMWGTVVTMAIVATVYIGLVIAANWFFPGVGVWAAMGLIPLAGALVMGLCLRRGKRQGFLTAVTVASVLFMGLVVAFPPAAMEPFKGPKELVRMSGVDDPNRDIRLGQFEGLPPSLVFYAGREIKELLSPDMVAEFLAVPTPAYLFIQEKTWEKVVSPKMTVPVRVVARHYDLLRKGNMVVVTNEPSIDVAAKAK